MAESETLIYARVSTAQQDLEAQEQDAWEYVTETLGVPQDRVKVFRDESSGGNTDRSGYNKMMDYAKQHSDTTERVVVREVSRIARNMRDLNQTVGELVDDNAVAVHVMDVGLKVGEERDDDASLGDSIVDDRTVLQLLGLAAEIEHKMIKQRTRTALRIARSEGKHTGRPPYGFDTDDDGYLVPNEEQFAKALDAIEGVREMGWSVRQAARHTGTARSTVRNILDREEFYREHEAGETEVDA